MIRFIQSDARRLPLADSSVHCVVTSPPYWGPRDYGTGQWQGGDPACDHLVGVIRTRFNLNRRSGEIDGDARTGKTAPRTITLQYPEVCRKCGARRIDGQIGRELTPQQYVAQLVGVFREVRRVLREDGTLWLNLGSSYAGSNGVRSDPGEGAGPVQRGGNDRASLLAARSRFHRNGIEPGVYRHQPPPPGGVQDGSRPAEEVPEAGGAGPEGLEPVS